MFGDYLSVDLFVMVAELRLHMMSLILHPIFLAHARPPAAAGRDTRILRRCFRRFVGGNRKSRRREALRLSQGRLPGAGIIPTRIFDVTCELLQSLGSSNTTNRMIDDQDDYGANHCDQKAVEIQARDASRAEGVE